MASVAMPSAVSKPKVTSVSDHIVVDGLGQGDDIQALLHQALGVLLRASAAEADQHVEMISLVVLDDGIGHVHGLAADQHAVRLVPAGAQDRAADGEDAGQSVLVQRPSCGSPPGRGSRRGSRSLPCESAPARPCRRPGWPRSGRGCRRPRSRRQPVCSWEEPPARTAGGCGCCCRALRSAFPLLRERLRSTSMIR